MNQKRIEQQGLLAGIIVNLAMGGAGLWVYQLTKIQALFVDAYFTIIALASGIAAIFISKISPKKTKHFPQGLFLLEPLYAIVKSLLSIFLLCASLLTVSKKAFLYFAYGQGEKMNIGPVIPYEIIMVILCLGLSWYYYRQNQKMNGASTLLQAETKGTMIDGIMSAGIGLTALIVFFIKEDSIWSFLLYTGDFFITSILASLTIKTPFRVLKEAFIELSGGKLTDAPIQETIKKRIENHLEASLVLEACTIYKVGMLFKVCAKVKSKTQMVDTKDLLKKKEAIQKELSAHYEFLQLEFIWN
ncbi:MAG: cation transporter [Bacillus sp. (in: firmicutes)]